jgi:hypothetical protein
MGQFFLSPKSFLYYFLQCLCIGKTLYHNFFFVWKLFLPSFLKFVLIRYIFFSSGSYFPHFYHLPFCIFIIFTFIHMCIHSLGPLPHRPPLPLFCPFVLWFCVRENIENNKKDIAFLLVWDKDSHTERFLAFLQCTCILQSSLVRLYQTSSLLPGPLPIVASEITIFSPVQWAHQPHSSFRFPSISLFLPCMISP